MSEEHTLPTTADDLRAEQTRLGALRPELWQPPQDQLPVGGCFVAIDRGIVGPGAAGDRAWAAAVCMQGQRVVANNIVCGTTVAPYEPGLLFLRVGRLLLGAVAGLCVRPDLLLVNGTGRDHPRRAGLALHLGVLVDLHTVGVTDRTLVARAGEPEDVQGAAEVLWLEHEVVGWSLRVRRGVRPIIVHSGWRTDADTALEVGRTSLGRGRTPQPLREARRLARRARARNTAPFRAPDGVPHGDRT